jgi:hypothetical protein
MTVMIALKWMIVAAVMNVSMQEIVLGVSTVTKLQTVQIYSYVKMLLDQVIVS